MWDEVLTWLASLGEDYGVDPLIYAILYVGAAPFFFGSLAWLIRSIRRRKSLVAPAISTAFSFSLPTLYVFVAGRGLPWWIYATLVGLAVIGGIGVAGRIGAALRRSD
jgi:hypothetical protein